MDNSEMILVESSTINKIGYADDGDLVVEFASGTMYTYHNVPVSVFEEFKKAESKGKFLNAMIKGNYDYQKK